MAVERRRQPLKVEIPQDDSPRLGRVGLIAVAGFAIGAVWPMAANFKLVPSAPTPAGPAPGLGGEPVPASARSVVPPPPAPPQPAAPTEVPAAAGPVIGDLSVVSCRDQRGRRVEQCDKVDFDRVARTRLGTLAACDGAAELSGVLSLGFEVDFEKNRLVRVASGKSTTLEASDAEAIVECAKKAFADVNLEGLEHEQSAYNLFYRLEFTAAPSSGAEGDEGAAAPAADVPVTPASGRATVSWEVALVRSGPSRDGKVVARILSGTRVVVTGRSGDWYQIKYDTKGTPGWVFRTAIGM
jgi:hypothetical protein